MINFDLALAPAMTAFGIPISVVPTVSQPGAPTYAARGVWSLKAVQIPLDDGTYQSTNQPMLGIRLADFAASPLQGDGAIINGASYDIIDVVLDGQGGADLWIRAGKTR